MVAKKGMVLKHFDVRTTYRYGDIDEEIYMCQLLGYKVCGKKEIVFQLRRSIYG